MSTVNPSINLVAFLSLVTNIKTCLHLCSTQLAEKDPPDELPEQKRRHEGHVVQHQHVGIRPREEHACEVKLLPLKYSIPDYCGQQSAAERPILPQVHIGSLRRALPPPFVMSMLVVIVCRGI